jgi:hypothetical protein
MVAVRWPQVRDRMMAMMMSQTSIDTALMFEPTTSTQQPHSRETEEGGGARGIIILRDT